jgi:hypothetical protein
MTQTSESAVFSYVKVSISKLPGKLKQKVGKIQPDIFKVKNFTLTTLRSTKGSVPTRACGRVPSR